MELRQLKYFLKAKELLNFTAAAEALNISQSTLSQQIKQLEDEINVPLFNRIGKRIMLTEAGNLFSEYAAQSVNRANDGLVLMKDLSLLQTGRLFIGVTYALRNLLTKALIIFSERYPNIKINVIFGTTRELIDKLDHTDLDCILTFRNESESSSFNYQPLFSSPMTLVVSKNSILAKKKSITINEILKVPLALPDSGYSTTYFIKKILESKNIEPNISVEINDIPTLLELVKTNNWNTILTAISVNDPELVTIPITGKNMLREATVISLKEAYQKRSMQEFLGILANILPAQASSNPLKK